jgi:hypothetical protein
MELGGNIHREKCIGLFHHYRCKVLSSQHMEYLALPPKLLVGVKGVKVDANRLRRGAATPLL